MHQQIEYGGFIDRRKIELEPRGGGPAPVVAKPANAEKKKTGKVKTGSVAKTATPSIVKTSTPPVVKSVMICIRRVEFV